MGKSGYTVVLLLIAAMVGFSVFGEAVLDPLAEYRANMPSENLEAWCARWDAALPRDVLVCERELLPEVITFAEGTILGSVHILKYTNPEVVRRVLGLYLAEYQFWYAREVNAYSVVDVAHASEEQAALWEANCRWYKRLLEASVERHGNRYEQIAMNRPGRAGDFESDYLNTLATIAESTFVSSVYQEVWSFPNEGELHADYLAMVNTKDTLNSLLNSTTERHWTGVKTSGDILYRPADDAAISLTRAFQVLNQIVKFRPKVAEAQREAICDFLDGFVFHFYETQKPNYAPVRDYMLRYWALEILREIGREQDIPFVERIGRDAPTKKPPTFRKEFDQRMSIEKLAERARSAIQVRSIS